MTILASSAPDAPLQLSGNSTVSPRYLQLLIFFAWTFRISSRPCRSGSSTGILRSKRPGRSSAGSRESGRLVAARMTTPFGSVKSVHLSQQLVQGLFALIITADIWPSRFLPIVSISSIKTIHGAFSFACLNRSRTFAAPIPTNISTNSDPEMEKNGTSASPATALASNVLPVPGGPTSRTLLLASVHRYPGSVPDDADNLQSLSAVPLPHPHLPHQKT